ncbi:hypothetical protein I3843_Q052000 [Carya illinoinensis]|nr:hypothetical protein I3843_Q052000 [Carya illinoinensis]
MENMTYFFVFFMFQTNSRGFVGLFAFFICFFCRFMLSSLLQYYYLRTKGDIFIYFNHLNYALQERRLLRNE